MTAAQPETDQAKDFGEPEEVVLHKVYPGDAAVSLAWGVMPGTALCGFVFTTANDLGPGEVVENDPRFVTKECGACQAVATQHLLEWLDEQ